MSDTYNISIGSQPHSPLAAQVGSHVGAAAGSGGITADNAGLLMQVMNGGFADGNFDQGDLAAMNAVLGKPSSDSGCAASSSSCSSNEMSDADFMKAVDDIAHQSAPGIGPGEKMMKKEAQRLVDGGGTAEDKQAFLAEANKLLNTGGSKQDINEIGEHEGTRLAGFTDALLADNPAASSADGSSGASGQVADFIGKAYADKALSDTELQGLKSLLGSVAASDSSSGSGSTNSGYAGSGTTTASSNYSYNDLVKSFIYSNMANNIINQDSAELALSYLDDDEDA
jgi:hypothetical protein